SSIITIFAIRSAENISNLRKEKGKAEKLHWFACNHHPRHLGGETDDRFVCTRCLEGRRDCDHVCLISRMYFTQEILGLNGIRCTLANKSKSLSANSFKCAMSHRW